MRKRGSRKPEARGTRGNVEWGPKKSGFRGQERDTTGRGSKARGNHEVVLEVGGKFGVMKRRRERKGDCQRVPVEEGKTVILGGHWGEKARRTYTGRKGPKIS